MDSLDIRLQRAAVEHCPGLTLPRDLGLRLVAEVFASDGNEEDRWIEATQNACPACGGSGHKGDCAASLLDTVAEINFLRAELATADDRAKDAHAVGFAAGIEGAAAVANRHQTMRDMRVGVYECQPLSGPIIADAIRALTPPDITAAAARVLLADDVALSKMAEDMTETMRATEKGAPPWSRWPERQKAFAVDTVRAAIRALAEMKP